MASSMNKCFFLGNLTRDPDLKYTPKSTAVADIGLACNETYTTDSGEKREKVVYLNLTAWGKTAEIAEKYLFKGSLALFECKATFEQWDDKQTGQKRSKVGFRVEHLTLMPNKRRSEDDGGGEPEDDDPPPRQQKKAPPARKPTPTDPDLDAAEEDDVPF